jgi:hypothetical protein
MRKIIFGLIATALISNLSFGQAILEHTYVTKIIGWEQTNAFKTDAGLNYYTVEGTNILKIYNSSHSLTNTVTIPIDSGYELNGIYGVSDKLFNTDALTEFLVFTYATGGTYKLTLINQNGTVLQQLGDRGDAYIIKGASGEFKLITVKNLYDTQPNALNNTYDIWTLPGTSLGTVMLNKNASSFFGFPNPTENKIAITNNLENGQNGTLEVFDANEKKVMQKNVVGENGEINLDVTELSNGVYIYKLNGQTNRFIKK